MKKLLSLSLVFSLIVASPLLAMEEIESQYKEMSFSEFDMSSNIDLDEATLEFSPESVRADGLEENVGLFYDKEGFFVRTDDEDIRVQTYDTDKLLRGRKIKEVARYATQGKFKVSKFDNGEYAIAAHGDLKGGGVWGATVGFYTGKFLVHFVGHGAILVAGACTGPAAPATIAALEATFLPVIEATSNVVAVGGGIAGGVATGPV